MHLDVDWFEEVLVLVSSGLDLKTPIPIQIDLQAADVEQGNE